MSRLWANVKFEELNPICTEENGVIIPVRDGELVIESQEFYCKLRPVPKPVMTTRSARFNPRYWTFKEEISKLAKEAGFTLAAQNVIVFYVPMPKSWDKAKATHDWERGKKKDFFRGKPHQATPDDSNLLKALEDCLLPKNTGGDEKIWATTPIKIWSDDPGIYIKNLPPDDPRIWAIIERANNYKEKR